MSAEIGHSHEVDLESTDRLPILQGVEFDPDVADDAVRLEHTPPLSAPPLSSPPREFSRPLAIDLPSLAASVRSVEERIGRQNAEFDALTRSYDRLRDAESAATTRVAALQRDLAAAAGALEGECNRTRELDQTLAEKNAAAQMARSRLDEALRDAERQQTETRTLRDSLAARDATIVQVLHSLGERDAQLSALQAEHARALPALEARAHLSARLDSELSAARAQLTAAKLELKTERDSAAAIQSQQRRRDNELRALHADLSLAKQQAASHLERLRTRDWRQGFDDNMLRELDAKAAGADSRRGALEADNDRLCNQMTALENDLAARRATIVELEAAAAAQSAAAAAQAKHAVLVEQVRGEWQANVRALEADRARLSVEIAAKDQTLKEAQTALAAEAQRSAQRSDEHAATLKELEADANSREEELTVLMAHLQEARRPIESIEGDARRLKEEIALKSLAIDQLTEEAEQLRTALQRTRGALEEREFLIRRLERSESNNANALGRIQTSVERLNSVTAGAPAVSGAAGAGADWAPQLVRIDGDRSVTHALGRRTRIGRAPGCELQIDSSSVSRHHALILTGTREAIIEDLNSTNGVILNGRRVTRQVLNGGDIVTIGEIQFRFACEPAAAPAPMRDF